MNLEQCYASFGGDYGKMRIRIPNDALIKRFVMKFLSDESYKRLSKAMAEGDYEEAFKASHTLKGVCENLSFERLSHSVTSLTEFLRGRQTGQMDKVHCEELWQQVAKDYGEVVEAINSLTA